MGKPGLRRASLPRLLTILLVGAPSIATAQVQAGMTMGVSMPSRSPLVKEFGGVNGNPVSYPVLEKWQVVSFVLFARVTRWTSGRLGFEATAGVSPGRVASSDSTNRVRESFSLPVMLSLRAPIRLSTTSTGLIVHFAPGLGYILYGGPAWNGFTSRGQPAAVLALGGRGRMGRRSRMWFRFDIEDWVSRTAFSAGGVPLTRRLHNFANYSAGLVFQLGNRR